VFICFYLLEIMQCAIFESSSLMGPQRVARVTKLIGTPTSLLA